MEKEETLEDKQKRVIEIKKKNPELGILGVKGHAVLFDKEKVEFSCKDIDYFLDNHKENDLKYDME